MLIREQHPRISVRDLRGDLWRQLVEPGAVAGHDVAVTGPALRYPGVGAEQETIRIPLEQCAPFRGQLAGPIDDAAAVGKLAPELLVFCEHCRNAIG